MQKIKFLNLSEFVRCYFVLIFSQRVQVILVDCFRNSKVLKFFYFNVASFKPVILMYNDLKSIP